MQIIGKQILEDLTELVDEDLFWSWFEPDQFYNQTASAFKDEGDDFSCNLCDFAIEVSDGNEDDTEETMADHIFEEHAAEITLKAIRLQFTVKHSEGKQTSLEIDTRCQRHG